MVKNYAKLEEVPVSRLKVEGWMLEYLKLQKDGLTGHLEVAGYPFDRIGWDRSAVDTSDSGNPGWWVYEQTAYWLDGKERVGRLLSDKKLCGDVSKSIEYTISNRDADGYMGPKFLKEANGWNRWPHVVFFRALMARYQATGDKQIIDVMTEHYLNNHHDYSHFRDVINVEIMLWLYLQNGNKKLLELAENSFAEYNVRCNDDNCQKSHLSNKKPYAHGVSYNEFAKLGAILYICTGKKDYLRPTLKAYKKIDRYHMLPDGLHCSNEFLLNNDVMQTHETCNVTDYTWALGYVLMATGKAEYADKIERCVLNAGIGSVTEDFKALQYFSGVNQLIADKCSNHNDFFKGDGWMSYRPNPGTECCAGNVNRFFPIYCSRMYLKKGRSLSAVFYGESSIKFGGLKIEQHTDYPFEDTVRFVFSTDNIRTLDFRMRIPGWCNNPNISVNGESVNFDIKNGFAILKRSWADGDVVTLHLPAQLKTVDYGKNGIFVERGPLLFTYGMKGERKIDKEDKKSTSDFPAYNIYPDKKWNYAFLQGEMSLQYRPQSLIPWSIDTAPMVVTVSAKEVKNWTLLHTDKVRAVKNLYKLPWARELKKGDFVFTPPIPSEEFIEKNGLGEEEKITLVPYACAKLRLTVFPKAK